MSSMMRLAVLVVCVLDFALGKRIAASKKDRNLGTSHDDADKSSTTKSSLRDPALSADDAGTVSNATTIVTTKPLIIKEVPIDPDDLIGRRKVKKQETGVLRKMKVAHGNHLRVKKWLQEQDTKRKRAAMGIDVYPPEDLPKTRKVTWNDAKAWWEAHKEQKKNGTLKKWWISNPQEARTSLPPLSFMEAKFGDAGDQFMNVFKGKRVVLLNFANGNHPGGGYKFGAPAQEEDLCRQFPQLFESLDMAYRLPGQSTRNPDGEYPFGPEAAEKVLGKEYANSADVSAKQLMDAGYSDVLVTQDIPSERTEDGGSWTSLDNLGRATWKADVVSAAAPDLRATHWKKHFWFIHTKTGKRQPHAEEALKAAITNMFLAPLKAWEDACVKAGDTFGEALPQKPQGIVVGAWGCGVFANNPREIAELFLDVIREEELSTAYENIIFAVPKMRDGDTTPGFWRKLLKVQTS